MVLHPSQLFACLSDHSRLIYICTTHQLILHCSPVSITLQHKEQTQGYIAPLRDSHCVCPFDLLLLVIGSIVAAALGVSCGSTLDNRDKKSLGRCFKVMVASV